MLDRRNRVVLLSLVAAALVSGIFAPTACAQNQKIEQGQAIELETHFERALVSGNKEALESLLADDVVVIYATGEVLSKEQVISRLSRSGDLTRWFLNFTDGDRKVVLTSSDAIVTGKGEQLLVPVACITSGPRTGCSGPMHTIYLSTIWTHTHKGWQIIFCQGTPALEPVRSDDAPPLLPLPDELK